MNRDFRWPRAVDLWVPLALPPSAFTPQNWFNEHLSVVARMRPGVPPAQADVFLTNLRTRVLDEAPPQAKRYVSDAGWSISTTPFRDSSAGETKTPVLILLGAVGAVLLIACSNIAGLMLARTSARARELAVRASLGATRVRLIRGVVAESLLLSLTGGAVGVAIAQAAARLLLQIGSKECSRRPGASPGRLRVGVRCGGERDFGHLVRTCAGVAGIEVKSARQVAGRRANICRRRAAETAIRAGGGGGGACLGAAGGGGAVPAEPGASAGNQPGLRAAGCHDGILFAAHANLWEYPTAGSLYSERAGEAGAGERSGGGCHRPADSLQRRAGGRRFLHSGPDDSSGRADSAIGTPVGYARTI